MISGHELENKCRRQEDCIRGNNHAVLDIIPLGEDKDASPSMGTPVSDNKSSVDYSLVHPTK